MKKTAKPEGVPLEAAKTTGQTAGKVAALVGAGSADAPLRKAVARKGKLVKKDKYRLPRRQKKAKMKAAGNPLN
jgi:hypothetical protein